ncbi:MAG: 16S rRNA (adenine(1518)-N(6)/adenine(1519)-N(6))-dimethyltransferase RsmA [Geminicoccaceae bacterium]
MSGPEALAALPPLREVIRAHGLDARKSLGQNFILDGNILAKIVRAAGDLEDRHVLEIGPGPGGLTRAILAAGAARLTAIERDRRCIDALQELHAAAGGRLALIEADALRWQPAPGERLTVIANLPYNIATPLLFGWLDRLEHFERFILMFQKEVALRLTASVGSADYGRLAVKTQWLCQARRLFDLPPSAFVPPPKVTSSVVELVPRAEPLAQARVQDLDRVTAAAFNQRRKMLRTSLKAITPDPLGLCAAASLDPSERPERVPIAGFCALARALALKGTG